MPAWDWQTAIALLCVAGAAAVLVRRAVRLWSGGSKGCGACPSRGASNQAKQLPLVSLDPPDSAKPKERRKER